MYDHAIKKNGILYPWKIYSESVPGITFSDFFSCKVSPERSDHDSEIYILKEAYLGNSREKLNHVEGRSKTLSFHLQ